MTMPTNEFFSKYANTPLKDRFTVLNFTELGDMTLASLYKEVQRLEDEMRPLRIEQDKLIRAAETFWLMQGNKKEEEDYKKFKKELVKKSPSGARQWERHYRDDKGVWEDICPHGVGHENGIHGCDGCCKDLYSK